MRWFIAARDGSISGRAERSSASSTVIRASSPSRIAAIAAESSSMARSSATGPSRLACSAIRASCSATTRK